MFKEFMGFLKQYGVIGLAIAIVIGGKASEVVKSVVDNLVMPLLGITTPGGEWRTMGFKIGEATFGVGAVLGSLVDFVIVAFLVFLFAKKVLKEETVTKK
jgi:large conductance mechanosensitive channel